MTSRQQHLKQQHTMDSPKVLDREGVFEALGYNPSKQWKPFNIKLPEDKEVCHRCGKKVYPVEKVDVGVLYHQGCFKCRVCNCQLSLRNFQQQPDPTTRRKEVYCNTHNPTYSVGLMESEALGIKAALSSQKNRQQRGYGGAEEGWEYDSQALEFQHYRSQSPEKKKVRRSSTLRSFRDFEKYGIFDAQSALERVQKDEEDQLYVQMAQDRQAQQKRLERFIMTEKNRTVQEIIQGYEKRLVSEQDRDHTINKAEEYFGKILEERMKLLLQRVAAEEQAAVARMTEKHAQEMIALIADKEQQVEEDMRRQQEKFEREHQLELVKKEKAEAAVRHREEFSKMREEHHQNRDNPELFFNQVELVGSMGIKHQKFSTVTNNSSSSEDIVQTASKPDSRQQYQLTAEEQIELDPNIDQKTKESLKNKITKGTNKNPTSRQLAAGFVPIIELEKEPKHFPDKEWSVEQFESSDDEEDIQQIKARQKQVKTYVPDLQKQFAAVKMDEEEFDMNKESYYGNISDQVPYDEEELEDSEYSGSDETSHTKSTGETPNSNGSACIERFDKQGKPFVRLDKPMPHSEPVKPKKVLHDNRKHGRKAKLKADYNDDSEMEGSYNVEEAEFRDNKINEEIHRSRLAEVAAPKVVPPQDSKSKLYSDASIFAALDNNAIKEAQKSHKTYTELVRLLSVRCDDELHKVRAIFRWLTVKDLNKLKFEDSLHPDSPMAILGQIKQGAESYHNLFKRLCSYAGLHCEIIEGYSKGAGYKPGTKIQSEVFRNQWTAVCVDGSWRFINTNWGARHVKRPGEEVLTYKCDEFYFLTDPNEHIYQHFPDDPVWQLLEKPITIEKFLQMPVVKSTFFNLDLAFAKNYRSVLETHSGIQEIRILCPHWYNFAGKLQIKDKSISSEALQEHILVKTVGQDVVLQANLPKPGRYYFDMFVAIDPRNDSMDHACGFLINCLSTTKENLSIFPQVGMYGRTPYFEKYQFEEETHQDPYLECKDDIVLALTMHKSVRMSQSFQVFNEQNRSFTDCDRFVFLKHKGDGIVSYVVRCPQKGIYLLTLMAETYNEETHTTGNIHPIFRYLIHCKHSSSHNRKPFPKTSKRWHHCKLLSPYSGDLPENTGVQFKIDSSIARDMAVVIDNDWTHLECQGHIWQGVVQTKSAPGKLFVYGRIDNNKKYIPCLEYFVVNKKEH